MLSVGFRFLLMLAAASRLCVYFCSNEKMLSLGSARKFNDQMANDGFSKQAVDLIQTIPNMEIIPGTENLSKNEGDYEGLILIPQPSKNPHDPLVSRPPKNNHNGLNIAPELDSQMEMHRCLESSSQPAGTLIHRSIDTNLSRRISYKPFSSRAFGESMLESITLSPLVRS